MDSSQLYEDLRAEAEKGKLPVVIPIREGVCYWRIYRAASWSAVFSEDEAVKMNTILACVIYTHNEASEGEHCGA